MSTNAHNHELPITIDDVLQALVTGQIDIAEATKKLSILSIKKVDELANLDIRRTYRTGVPEAILARGKEPAEILRLAAEMVQANGYALITKVQDFTEFERNPIEGCAIECNPKAQTVVVRRKGFVFPKKGIIGVLSAGTSDISVAEEVVVTAQVMGCEVIKHYDVGVAGVHRLYHPLVTSTTRESGATSTILAR